MTTKLAILPRSLTLRIRRIVEAAPATPPRATCRLQARPLLADGLDGHLARRQPGRQVRHPRNRLASHTWRNHLAGLPSGLHTMSPSPWSRPAGISIRSRGRSTSSRSGSRRSSRNRSDPTRPAISSVASPNSLMRRCSAACRRARDRRAPT